jgi:putative transposase
MPRGPRLDVPGTLHHVIFRGIEGNRIVSDDQDRNWLVDKMARLSYTSQTSIFAWAIMDNHVHLLLKSGPDGLSRFMRKLLTSYAITYNRRHKRHGYLFQNRFKSIICQEERYFLKLVSYIHLNPLRAGLVSTFKQLDLYPWSGHTALMGNRSNQWQNCEKVLSLFGSETTQARLAYREFLENQSRYERQPELTGGGIKRSDGGWSEIKSRKSNLQIIVNQKLILGDVDFANSILDHAQEHMKVRLNRENNLRHAREKVEKLCLENSISLKILQEGAQNHALSALRKKAALILVTEYSLTNADAARLLGISSQAVFKILKKEATGKNG